jgi:EmrB/QacA subfamily drug resistance transporter
MGNAAKPPMADAGVKAPAAEGETASKKVMGRWVLAATILGASMAYIDGTAINVALPAFQEQLGATIVDVQWVIEIYSLFLASLILVGGALGDRYGRRLIYGIGIALFASSSIMCGLSQNVDQLIMFRAVQGLGGALLIPGSLAIITVFFDESERGKAIGTWSAFSAITTAVGPVLGGWLIENVSWRWIFFINIPIAVVVLSILFLRVPESKGETTDCKIDYWGGVLVTAGLGGLVYGSVESSNLGFGNPMVYIPLVLGAAALAAFVIVEGRVEAPMVPLRLFSSRTFSGANLVTLLMYAALGGAFFFLPFALIQIYGYTATETGASFLPIILLLFVTSRWAGGLVDMYGAKLPLIIGPSVSAAGYILIILLGGEGNYFLTFFPGMVVFGFGLGLSVAPLTTAVMNAVHVSLSGTASGINNSVSRVASLLAIAVLGIVILHAFNFHLDAAMDDNGIPQEVRETFEDERIKLAGAEIPVIVGGEMKLALEQMVRESYVKGFHLVLSIAAALSLLSALTAWLTIGRKETEEPIEVEKCEA